ncbi:MAG: hypothetical protein EB829_01155 [Nitrosopumilus sp. H8]|nr:MAG: hypothetical protein EB829_01155 [Nitrosopumilus sp. H8]
MAEDSFWWIYLVFFMIPLARLLPRIIRRVRGDAAYGQKFEPRRTFGRVEEAQTSTIHEEQARTTHEEHTPDKKVLGQLSLGIRDFGRMRDNLGMNNDELDGILGKLEKQGLMKVVKKNGPFGIKVELHITEDGIKRYHS